MAKRDETAALAGLLIVGGGLIAAYFLLRKPEENGGPPPPPPPSQPTKPSVCEAIDFDGYCLDFNGPVEVPVLANIAKATDRYPGTTWDRVISSVYIPPPTSAGSWQIALYEEYYFGGGARFLGYPGQSNLVSEGWNDRARSLKVTFAPPPSKTCAAQGGQCTGPDFCVSVIGGRCIPSTDCTRCCCSTAATESTIPGGNGNGNGNAPLGGPRPILIPLRQVPYTY